MRIYLPKLTRRSRVVIWLILLVFHFNYKIDIKLLLSFLWGSDKPADMMNIWKEKEKKNIPSSDLGGSAECFACSPMARVQSQIDS